MLNVATLVGEQDIAALLSERRGEERYHCHFHSLCQANTEDQGALGQTCGMAEVVDLSPHGIRLSIPFPATAGTEIALRPLIGSWKEEWVLTARITNVQRVSARDWRAGCEFLEPLNQSQLNILLRNSA